jgi:DNA modification methylase
MDFIDKIFNSDALTGLKQIPSNSADCCVSSPPYWGLRSYIGVPQGIWGGDKDCEHQWVSFIRKGISGGTKTEKLKTHGEENFQIVPDSEQASCAKCGAWRGCLGLEPELEQYVSNLCEIFDEVYRVLKPTGTCFLNVGDCFLGSGKGVWKGREKANKESFKFEEKPVQLMGGWKKPKQLALVPFRVAIEMQNRGWLLRNVINWRKPNQLPSSTKDRFTCDSEPVFFFTKQQKYYFEQQLEPFSNKSKPDEIYTGQATKDYESERAQNPSDTKRRILESMRKTRRKE